MQRNAAVLFSEPNIEGPRFNYDIISRLFHEHEEELNVKLMEVNVVEKPFTHHTYNFNPGNYNTFMFTQISNYKYLI